MFKILVKGFNSTYDKESHWSLDKTPLYYPVFPTELACKTHLLVVAVVVGGDVGTFVTGAGVVVLLPSSKSI